MAKKTEAQSEKYEKSGWGESAGERHGAAADMSAVRLGLIVMASGWSRRYGRNKLLDSLAGKPMLSYVLRELSEAVLVQNRQGAISELVSDEFHINRSAQIRFRPLLLETPLVVSRFPEVQRLAEGYGLRVLMHSDPDQSDTIRHGLSIQDAEGWDGCMFLTGDQPLLSAESVLRLARAFRQDPERVYRLSFNQEPGNPVIFPKKYFENLKNLTGDHGGGVLLKNGMIPSEDICLVNADREFELWDVDTEESQMRLERILSMRY